VRLGEVLSRGEGPLAGARQDDGADRRVGIEAAQRLDDRRAHVAVPGIELLRLVEPDQADLAADFGEDEGVLHGKAS
jgi:hypothetical protein